MANSWNPAVIGEKLEDLTGVVKNITNGMNYDSDEVDTGKKWISGSPIYRKVFYVESMPNATTASFDHGISNLSLVLSADCVAAFVEGTHSGFVFPNATTSVNLTTGKVYIATTANLTTYSCYIILEYVKSASLGSTKSVKLSLTKEE